MAVSQHNNTRDWLEANQKFFLPPVCNKMMHNDQLKVNQGQDWKKRLLFAPSAGFLCWRSKPKEGLSHGGGGRVLLHEERQHESAYPDSGGLPDCPHQGGGSLLASRKVSAYSAPGCLDNVLRSCLCISFPVHWSVTKQKPEISTFLLQISSSC